jgi:hypothetical protein
MEKEKEKEKKKHDDEVKAKGFKASAMVLLNFTKFFV